MEEEGDGADAPGLRDEPRGARGLRWILRRERVRLGEAAVERDHGDVEQTEHQQLPIGAARRGIRAPSGTGASPLASGEGRP